MNRGTINIEDDSSPVELDNIIENGIYIVAYHYNTWATLVVYNSFVGAGGVVQELYETGGKRKWRINEQNSNVKWSEWL